MPWVRWPWVPHARCRRPQLRSHARRSPRLPQVRRRPRGNQRSRWPQLPQARHPWGKSNSPSAADSSLPTAADSSPLAAAHSSPMAAAHSSLEHGPVDPSLAQGGLPVPVGCPVLVLSPRGLLILTSMEWTEAPILYFCVCPEGPPERPPVVLSRRGSCRPGGGSYVCPVSCV